MTADITLIPSLVDSVIMGPTPGIDAICVDADPDMTKLMAEPTPAYGPADLMMDERSEG